MKVLYFAWLRERIGLESEVVSAEGLATLGDLVAHLKARGGGYASAFESEAAVKAAINLDFAGPDAPIKESDEIAFFPPVTGG